MALRVIGAGLGRTGTNSLKLALEQLLGGRVHHMYEVFAERDRQFQFWNAATDGAPYEEWSQRSTGSSLRSTGRRVIRTVLQGHIGSYDGAAVAKAALPQHLVPDGAIGGVRSPSRSIRER